MDYAKNVERWGVQEITVHGPADGNPFAEHFIRGIFRSDKEIVTANGFYDGDGLYKVRFMPSFEGEYMFAVEMDFAENVSGTFTVTPAGEKNHGPVRVNGSHFAYEDGTPYHPMGTTCYVWTWQGSELEEKTLKTLSEGYFNKIRMAVFPKHYLHNLHEPTSYPYYGTPCKFEGNITWNFMDFMKIPEDNNWDFSQFNPEHFRHLEKRVGDLADLGIEADVILFHPYDRWGFSRMTMEQNISYLKYVTARLAAYRNVWWSMANEYDILTHLSIADWEKLAMTVCENDPYHHLRSIHNCITHYDYTRPWITHCSIQRNDNYKSTELTDGYLARYGKPVIMDEVGYEGDVDQGWGNLTGQELVRRFWEAACRGGYASHGETYLGCGPIWWSHGGELHGESQERLRFLQREIFDKLPGEGLRHVEMGWDDVAAQVPGTGYYLFYYGFFRPSYRWFFFDDTTDYKVEVIDTWDMTVTDAGIHRGHFKIDFPRKQFIAVRINAVPKSKED